MHAVADALSDDDKVALIRENFTPGHVFYLYARFLSRPKDKYFLLVSPTDPPLFLIFNTNIPSFLERIPRLKACQVPIAHESNTSAVEHDCYLDCTEAFRKFSFDDVCQQAKKDMTRVRGSLSNDALKQAYLGLQRDKRIALNLKVRMLGDLRAHIEA